MSDNVQVPRFDQIAPRTQDGTYAPGDPAPAKGRWADWSLLPPPLVDYAKPKEDA